MKRAINRTALTASQRDKAFVHILSGILAFNLLLVSLIFALIYGAVRKRTLTQIHRTEQEAISNISYSASIMRETAASLLAQMSTSPEMLRLIYSSDLENVDNIHSMYLLRNYASLSPWIDSAYIYNAGDRFVTYTYTVSGALRLSFCGADRFFDRELLEQLSDVHASFAFPIQRKFRYGESQPLRTLFTYALPIRNSVRNVSGMFVINIRPEQLMEINYGFSNSANRQILVASSSENYYASNHSLLDAAALHSLLEQVFRDDSKGGQLLLRDAGVICTWVRSPDSPLCFITCIPYSRVEEQLRAVNRLFVIYYCIILALAVTVTGLLSRRIRTAYSSLREQYGLMEKDYTDNYRHIKNAILRDFLSSDNGTLPDSPGFSANRLALQSYAQYSLTLLRVAPNVSGNASPDSSPQFLRFALPDALQHALNGRFRCEIVDMLQQRQLLICDCADYGALHELLTRFAAAFSRQHGCTLSGISIMRLSALEELPKAAQQLVEQMDFLFFYPPGSFLDYADLKSRPLHGTAEAEALRPHLLRSLRGQQFHEAAEALSGFFSHWLEAVEDVPRTTAVFIACFSEYIAGIERSYGPIIKFDTVRFQHSAARCETSMGVEQLFLGLLQDISSSVRSVQHRSSYVDQLLSFIEAHYSDTQLNTDSLAAVVGLSTAHMQSVFKAETGNSISSYLRNYRMEKAARLLTGTDLPINEIALQTGFANTNYFSTMFKKNYMVTPNEYRITNRLAGSVRRSGAPQTPDRQAVNKAFPHGGSS